MLNINLSSNWLDEQAKLSGDKIALLSSQVELTYKQLSEAVQQRADELTGEINAGEIIGIPADHSPQFIIDLYAVWSMDGAVLPINPWLPENEIDKQINLTGCKNVSNINSAKIKNVSPQKYSADKTALLMFTSGSTGEQKAVQHTFNSLYSSAESIDRVMLFQTGDKWLASLPFYRIGGFQIILRSLLSGGTLQIPDSVKTVEIIKSASLYKPDYFSLVNASLKELLESDISVLHNCKAIFVGGGPVDSKIMNDGLTKGLPLYKVYGSTETGSMVSILSPTDVTSKADSAGKPLSGVKIELIDDEVCVSSGSLFTGYYNNQKLTDEKLKDKLFFTGDTGYFDEEGFLYIKNRKDNLIISGGEKINPVEIENELTHFDVINEAVVFGVPDQKWGQKICAVITAKMVLDINELKKLLKNSLPSYKIPKEIKQLPKIPIDVMGKIDRDELLKLFG